MRRLEIKDALSFMKEDNSKYEPLYEIALSERDKQFITVCELSLEDGKFGEYVKFYLTIEWYEKDGKQVSKDTEGATLKSFSYYSGDYKGLYVRNKNIVSDLKARLPEGRSTLTVDAGSIDVIVSLNRETNKEIVSAFVNKNF